MVPSFFTVTNFGSNMNVNRLRAALDYVPFSRNTLSNEQRVILQNSLISLQNENHFEQIFLWGQILGLDSDYYIAYGYERDALKDRVFYYSTNCIDWGLLPNPTKHNKKLTLLSSTRFQGDPALQLEVDTSYPVDIGDLSEEKGTSHTKVERPKVLKEEDRLAATVALISDEAALVPRGALFKRPDGYIVENLAFKGLQFMEAKELKSYQHYRIPQQRWNTNLLIRPDYNFALDFLDTIDIDIPKEHCWRLQIKQGGQMSILQSLYWPGMTFYHYICTAEHGFIYVGNGRKNMDLPFMI